MSEQNLPHPDSPVEEYLGVLCEQPGVEKPAHPSSSVERYLDYLCEHGGGGGSSSWEDVENKPFESVGSNLLVEDGVLKVDTTNNAEEDNTRPITSAGTYTILGNINTLLNLI